MLSAAWLLPGRHKYLIQVFLSAVALVKAGFSVAVHLRSLHAKVEANPK